ncbi:MAG: hypothetical protein GY940_21795 [bacterium]|nr:hypothetical protein [bacterium]
MASAYLSGLSFLGFYIYIVIPLAPVIYIFIKWRSYRDGSPPDPQLGAKVVLYYFRTLGYHLVLVALVVTLYGFFMPMIPTGVGFGLLVSGAVVFLAHMRLIDRMTNTLDFPLVERAYNGFNLIITGLVTIIAFTATMVTLFSSGFRGIELQLIAFLVYGAAWGFETSSFCKPLMQDSE